MGLRDFLFGKKKQKNESSDEASNAKILALMEAGTKFDLEIIEAFKRYHSDPTMDITIDIKDDKGNSYPPHMVYEDLFMEWFGIQSKWDRMSVLYKFWDKSQIEKLEDWQIMERYLKDRYPTQVLKYFKENVSTKESLNARELVAASKLHRVLLENDTARKYIETAYQNFPGDDIVKAEYATVLHLSKDHEEKESSHKILNEVLDKKIKQQDTKSVFDCFLFSENYVDSSVFAMAYLITTEANIDEWDHVAEEYYYCPLFRYEHAVKLSNTDEGLRALAKLTSVSQEFPWFKTALETTVRNIESMRIQLNSPNFMENELQEFQTRLRN